MRFDFDFRDWKADDFKPGEKGENGGWYNFFTNAIAKASEKHFFTWDKPRKTPENSKIANGVKKRLLELDFGVGYNPEFLNSQGESIKQQTLVKAIRLFFDHQLFKTTFADTN